MKKQSLEYFLQVCRTGSIAQAAKEYNVTPQAVAKAIKKLESELGMELLKRTITGSVPTQAGREAMHIAERMQRFEQQSMIQLGRIRKNAVKHWEVHIGMLTDFTQVLPSDSFSDFLLLYPEINLSVTEYSDSQHCENALSSGEVDLAFCQPSDLELIEALHTHTIMAYLIVGPEHRFAVREAVRMEELKSECFICDASNNKGDFLFSDILGKWGITPRMILPKRSDAAKRSIVSGGDFIAFSFCPVGWLPNSVVPVRIEDWPLPCSETSFCRKKNVPLSEASKAYADFIIPRFKRDTIWLQKN